MEYLSQFLLILKDFCKLLPDTVMTPVYFMIMGLIYFFPLSFAAYTVTYAISRTRDQYWNRVFGAIAKYTVYLVIGILIVVLLSGMGDVLNQMGIYMAGGVVVTWMIIMVIIFVDPTKFDEKVPEKKAARTAVSDGTEDETENEEQEPVPDVPEPVQAPVERPALRKAVRAAPAQRAVKKTPEPAFHLEMEVDTRLEAQPGTPLYSGRVLPQSHSIQTGGQEQSAGRSLQRPQKAKRRPMNDEGAISGKKAETDVSDALFAEFDLEMF